MAVVEHSKGFSQPARVVRPYVFSQKLFLCVSFNSKYRIARLDFLTTVLPSRIN